MGDGTEHIRELLKREISSRGTYVINCVEHSHIDMDKRSSTCKLCMLDLQNAWVYSVHVNEWLNEWRDDAKKILGTLI